jgi:hypothetical protein
MHQIGSPPSPPNSSKNGPILQNRFISAGWANLATVPLLPAAHIHYIGVVKRSTEESRVVKHGTVGLDLSHTRRLFVARAKSRSYCYCIVQSQIIVLVGSFPTAEPLCSQPRRVCGVATKKRSTWPSSCRPRGAGALFARNGSDRAPIGRRGRPGSHTGKQPQPGDYVVGFH